MQAFNYMDKIIETLKMSKDYQAITESLEVSLEQAKFVKFLPQDKHVKPEITKELEEELNQIWNTNSYQLHPEVWTAESLSFKFYNQKIEFKDSKKIWINWARACKAAKGPLSEEDLAIIEEKCEVLSKEKLQGRQSPTLNIQTNSSVKTDENQCDVELKDEIVEELGEENESMK